MKLFNRHKVTISPSSSCPPNGKLRVTWPAWPHNESHWPGNWANSQFSPSLPSSSPQAKSFHLRHDRNEDEAQSVINSKISAKILKTFFPPHFHQYLLTRDHGPIFVKDSKGKIILSTDFQYLGQQYPILNSTTSFPKIATNPRLELNRPEGGSWRGQQRHISLPNNACSIKTTPSQ